MPPQVTLKVLSYNVFMRDQIPNEVPFVKNIIFKNEERARLIARLIAQSDYDVVVLQEAFDDEARNEIIKILSTEGKFYHRTWVVGYSDEFDLHTVGGVVSSTLGVVFSAGVGIFTGGPKLPKSDGGIFIMSRWPISLQGQIIYRDSIKVFEDARAKKGVTWALIQKEGTFFNVFGTHTQAGSASTQPGSTPTQTDPGQGSVRPWGQPPAPEAGDPPQGQAGPPRPWMSPGPEEIRRKQLKEFRKMVDGVGLRWMPAFFAGDFNIDFCFEGDRQQGVCSAEERNGMFDILQAGMPQDISRLTYTSTPENDLKAATSPDDKRRTVLDYVTVSRGHLQPLRSSVETVKFQSPWTIPPTLLPPGRFNDLSDHFGVAGSFTIPKLREDSLLFTGEWKRVLLNGKPDTGDYALSCGPFGFNFVGTLGGRPVLRGRIQKMFIQDEENKGRLVLSNEVTRKEEQWYYAFNRNSNFEQYFVPGNKRFQKHPRSLNEMVLRAPGTTQVFAFVGWLEMETPERPNQP